MYTPLKLDKIRNLRYGMKAISVIEKTFNTKIAKIDFDNMGMEEIATIVWAGLVHEDKDLTVDKVMDLVDEFSDITTVIESMGKAFNESFKVKNNRKN